MPDIKDPSLLRTIIMQHYDKPTNKVDDLSEIDGYINYHNKSSSCIDDVRVYLKIENDLVIDAKFYGLGCAISTASTDIFCDLIKNKKIQEVSIILENYYKMINNESFDEQIMDELIAFSNIYQQPNRKNCAKMGADALKQIINNEQKQH